MLKLLGRLDMRAVDDDDSQWRGYSSGIYAQSSTSSTSPAYKAWRHADADGEGCLCNAELRGSLALSR